MAGRPGHSGDITVDVELLARRLMRKQAGAVEEEQLRAMATTHRISRVPDRLRDKYDEFCTPGFVAIGPLHNRKSRRLWPAERLKGTYLNALISRGYPDPAQHLAVIQEYVAIVTARELEARASYAAEEVADLTPDDFIQMMVLDGCFIIEHLVNIAIGREDPSLHATSFDPIQLSLDLILAENQIPFFVLVDLISSTKLPEFEYTGYAPPTLLVKLVLYYLAGEKGRDMSDALPAPEVVCHILHLLHVMITTARNSWELLPNIQDGQVLEMAQEAGRLLCHLPLLLMVPLLYRILPREYAHHQDVPSASDLKRMSVKIKKTLGGGLGSKMVTGVASVMGPAPLAVKLVHDEWLQLPQLWLEFRTAPLLLNLMAFERSMQPQQVQEVSAYVSFMAKMVRSAEDVGVLTAADVVRVHDISGGDSKDQLVMRFFQNMGAAASNLRGGGELDGSYLGPTVRKLKYRARPWTAMRTGYLTLLAELVTIVTLISGVTTIAQTYAAFKFH